MAEMTPRERVWAALNHQEPDRVPLDIGGGASTTIIEEGYANLKEHLGVKAEPRILNKIFRMARLDESVMQRLGSDCRPLGLRAPVNWTPPPAEPGKFTDIWDITWKQAHYGDGCYYWELDNCPMAEASVEDIETYPWPDLDDPGLVSCLVSLRRDPQFAELAVAWETLPAAIRTGIVTMARTTRQNIE